MICPRCGHTESFVIKTETIQEDGSSSVVKRRVRRCRCDHKDFHCEKRYTTYEISEADFRFLQEMKKRRNAFEPSQLQESNGQGTRLIVRPRKKV